MNRFFLIFLKSNIFIVVLGKCICIFFLYRITCNFGGINMCSKYHKIINKCGVFKKIHDYGQWVRKSNCIFVYFLKLFSLLTILRFLQLVPSFQLFPKFHIHSKKLSLFVDCFLIFFLLWILITCIFNN